MEKLAEKVKQILTQYLREEIGNRVSQFSVKGLTNVVEYEIRQYKPNEYKPIIKNTTDKSNKKKQ